MQQIGSLGEGIACRRLARQGYRILERNLRRAGGEIDIIALKDGVVVLLEVKTRRSASMDEDDYAQVQMIAAARAEQRERILRLGRRFLRERGMPNLPMRLGLVTVRLLDDRACVDRHHAAPRSLIKQVLGKALARTRRLCTRPIVRIFDPLGDPWAY